MPSWLSCDDSPGESPYEDGLPTAIAHEAAAAQPRDLFGLDLELLLSAACSGHLVSARGGAEGFDAGRLPRALRAQGELASSTLQRPTTGVVVLPARRAAGTVGFSGSGREVCTHTSQRSLPRRGERSSGFSSRVEKGMNDDHGHPPQAILPEQRQEVAPNPVRNRATTPRRQPAGRRRDGGVAGPGRGAGGPDGRPGGGAALRRRGPAGGGRRAPGGAGSGRAGSGAGGGWHGSQAAVPGPAVVASEGGLVPRARAVLHVRGLASVRGRRRALRGRDLRVALWRLQGE